MRAGLLILPMLISGLAAQADNAAPDESAVARATASLDYFTYAQQFGLASAKKTQAIAAWVRVKRRMLAAATLPARLEAQLDFVAANHRLTSSWQEFDRVERLKLASERHLESLGITEAERKSILAGQVILPEDAAAVAAVEVAKQEAEKEIAEGEEPEDEAELARIGGEILAEADKNKKAMDEADGRDSEAEELSGGNSATKNKNNRLVASKRPNAAESARQLAEEELAMNRAALAAAARGRDESLQRIKDLEQKLARDNLSDGEANQLQSELKQANKDRDKAVAQYTLAANAANISEAKVASLPPKPPTPSVPPIPPSAPPVSPPPTQAGNAGSNSGASNNSGSAIGGGPAQGTPSNAGSAGGDNGAVSVGGGNSPGTATGSNGTNTPGGSISGSPGGETPVADPPAAPSLGGLAPCAGEADQYCSPYVVDLALLQNCLQKYYRFLSAECRAAGSFKNTTYVSNKNPTHPGVNGGPATMDVRAPSSSTTGTGAAE